MYRYLYLSISTHIYTYIYIYIYIPENADTSQAQVLAQLRLCTCPSSRDLNAFSQESLEVSLETCCKGTSLIRIRTSLRPYRRPMPRVLGEWAFSYGRGTCVAAIKPIWHI